MPKEIHITNSLELSPIIHYTLDKTIEKLQQDKKIKIEISKEYKDEIYEYIKEQLFNEEQDKRDHMVISKIK